MPTSREASLAREAAKRASQIPRADRFPQKIGPLAKAAPAAQPVPALEDARRHDDWGLPVDERKLQPSQTYDGTIITITGSPPKLFIRPDYDWFEPGKQLDVIADLSCFLDCTGENQGARIGTHVKFTLSPDEPQWSQKHQANRFRSVSVWTGDPGPPSDRASRRSATPEPDRKNPGKKKKDVDEKKKLKNADRKKVGSGERIGKRDVDRKKKEDVDGKELGIGKRIAKKLRRGSAGKKKLGSGKRIHKEPSVERGSERGRVEGSVERSSKSKRKRKRTPSPEEEEEADSASESSESEDEPETRRRRTKVPRGRRPQAISPHDE